MSTDEPNKTDRKLPTTGKAQNLRGVVGDDTDAEDIDVFGFQVTYTTGEFYVDREALLNAADGFGIPEWMLPSETRPHLAFGRAIDDLLDGREEVEWEGQRVQFDLRQNDSRYSYTLDASVYFPPEMTDSPSGEWVAVENSDDEQGLGVIEYVNPDEGEARVEFETRIGEDMSLYPVWAAEREDRPTEGGLRQRMRALFEKHQDGHIGKNINSMTYYLVNQWTDSLRLRDSCYIVPANHKYTVGGEARPIVELIDAFADLYKWLDQAAEKPLGAEKTEMHSMEVMDTARQREMVETKVEERLDDMTADIVQDVTEAIEDEDMALESVEEVAEEMVAEVAGVAEQYDDLLDGGYKRDLRASNAIQRALDRSLSDLTEDQREQVEDLLAEVEDAPTPEAA